MIHFWKGSFKVDTIYRTTFRLDRPNVLPPVAALSTKPQQITPMPYPGPIRALEHSEVKTYKSWTFSNRHNPTMMSRSSRPMSSYRVSPQVLFLSLSGTTTRKDLLSSLLYSLSFLLISPSLFFTNLPISLLFSSSRISSILISFLSSIIISPSLLYSNFPIYLRLFSLNSSLFSSYSLLPSSPPSHILSSLLFPRLYLFEESSSSFILCLIQSLAQ